jgi:hypothetical protein
MTQLGGIRPLDLTEIIDRTKRILDDREIKLLDGNSEITGKDFLIKIWKLVMSVPMGVAIVTKTIKSSAIPNIFYEIGMMNTLGKDTIVIKCKHFKIPSDFIRTEYIEFDNETYDHKFNNYLDRVFDYSKYCVTMANNLTAKPILTLDYLRRAYLITGDADIKTKAEDIMSRESFDEHTLLMLKSAFEIK